MSQLAWHYTTLYRLKLIIASGELKTTSSQQYNRAKEKPVLWFSTNQFWEPTVIRHKLVDGEFIEVSRSEITLVEGCLVRLGYPLSKLIPWNDLWKEARIEPSIKQILEYVAKERQANPYHWFGCFQSIPIDELTLERMNSDDKWVLPPMRST
jgi:hypothetical protein